MHLQTFWNCEADLDMHFCKPTLGSDYTIKQGMTTCLFTSLSFSPAVELRGRGQKFSHLLLVNRWLTTIYDMDMMA